MSLSTAARQWPIAVSLSLHGGLLLSLLVVGIAQTPPPVIPPPMQTVTLHFIPAPPHQITPPAPKPPEAPPKLLESTSKAAQPIHKPPPPKRKLQATPKPAAPTRSETAAIASPAQPAPTAPSDAADASPIPVEPARPAASSAMPNYLSMLAAQLARFKDYPYAARRRGMEGIVRLLVVIGRDGRLISVTISGTSGMEILDRAALSMAERASPFPPLPEEHGAESLAAAVPISFSLR